MNLAAVGVGSGGPDVLSGGSGTHQHHDQDGQNNLALNAGMISSMSQL